MTPGQIVLLVLGILAAQLLLLIPLLYWLKRKIVQIAEELRGELAGETIVRGPEGGTYRGGTGEHPKVKGAGVLALTDRRLVFRGVFGRRIELAVADIGGVREDKWFLRAYASGRMHLVLKLRSGDEVGFMMRQHAAWMDAIRGLVGGG